MALSYIFYIINSYEDMYAIFKQEAAKKVGPAVIRCVNCCVRVN